MTETGTENDFGLTFEREYLNEEMLKHCLKNADVRHLLENKDFPLPALVRLFNVILEEEESFKIETDRLTIDRMVYLVKHVKEVASC